MDAIKTDYLYLPARKHLHRIPVRLPSERPVNYFVTQCCFGHRAVFDLSNTVRLALSCLIKIAAKLHWKIPLICFMPDHVHMFALPQEHREQALSSLMRNWKSSSTQILHHGGISGAIWQREFFDHLLRSDESVDDKWAYVVQNPVRGGLCAKNEDYRYSGTPEEILARLL
jgi:REP element-mobilizing transposase RayT